MISETTAKEYVGLCRARTARFMSHPQYDDILGEAILLSLQALSRIPEEKRETAHALVWSVAHHAACHFLRSPRNDHRTVGVAASRDRKKGKKQNVFSPRFEVDALPVEARDTVLGFLPDFVPSLIDRLDRERVWEEFWRTVSSEEEEKAVRLFLVGGAGRDTAEKLGISRTGSYFAAQRVFNRYRSQVGEPTKPDGRRDKVPAPIDHVILSPEDEEIRTAFEWYLYRDPRKSPYRVPYGAGIHGAVFLWKEVVTRRDGFTPPKGAGVDFRNGNEADFRRENLELLTNEEATRRTKARYRARKREKREKGKNEQPTSRTEGSDPGSGRDQGGSGRRRRGSF